MKKIIFFITITFIHLLIPAKIPLQMAIEKGIRLNIPIKNSLIEEKKQKLEKKNEKVKKLFTINFNSSYFFKSDQMEIEFPDSQLNNGITLPGEAIIVGARHNYDFKLTFSQPLFTGNIIGNSVKIKNTQITLAENNTQLNIIEITSQIKTSYFHYRLLTSKLNSLEILVNKLNLHQQKLHDFYKENLAKKSDLLETASRIQEQLINLEEIKNLIHKEKINFEVLCGINIDDICDDYSEESKNYQESLSDLQQYHPFLQFLDNRLKVLIYQKKIIKGEYLPHLNCFGELHLGKPGINYFKNEWAFYFQGGIRLDIKLFDWHKQKRNSEIINYSMEKIINKKKDFIKEREKYLKQLYKSKKSTEKKLSIIKNLIQIAQEDVQLKEELFREQQISNIDYLTSLKTKERYLSMENEFRQQFELIKANINKLTGYYNKVL